MLLVALHSRGEGERAAQAEVSEGDDHRLRGAVGFNVAFRRKYRLKLGDQSSSPKTVDKLRQLRLPP